MLAAAALSGAFPGWAEEPCPLIDNIQQYRVLALLGATVSRPEPDIDKYGQLYPEEIVLLRHGKYYRTIRGNVFAWDWIFWKDGQQIAMDTSPLHFMQVLVLIDVATGKEVDTFTIPDTPGEPPDWAKALQVHEAARIAPLPAPLPDCRFRLSSKTHSERR